MCTDSRFLKGVEGKLVRLSLLIIKIGVVVQTIDFFPRNDTSAHCMDPSAPGDGRVFVLYRNTRVWAPLFFSDCPRYDPALSGWHNPHPSLSEI